MKLKTSLVLLAVAAQACFTIPKPRVDVEELNQLDPGEAVAVGRVLLDPPMGKNEQTFSFTGAIHVGKDKQIKDMKEGVVLFVGDEPMPRKHEIQTEDYEGCIQSRWGSLFFAPLTKGDDILQAMVYTISYSTAPSVMTSQGARAFSHDLQRGYMPCNLKVDLRKGDQVVYIGTLKFKRDEFNTYKGVEVIDEYDQALSKIRKRFGAKAKVRKALVAK